MKIQRMEYINYSAVYLDSEIKWNKNAKVIIKKGI